MLLIGCGDDETSISNVFNFFAAFRFYTSAGCQQKRCFSFSAQGFYTHSTTQSKTTAAKYSDSGSGVGFSINYDRFLNRSFSLGLTAGVNFYPSRDQGDWQGEMTPVERHSDNYAIEWNTNGSLKQSRTVPLFDSDRNDQSSNPKWVTGLETISHRAFF